MGLEKKAFLGEELLPVWACGLVFIYPAHFLHRFKRK